jgi:hypothetical protein
MTLEEAIARGAALVEAAAARACRLIKVGYSSARSARRRRH